MVSSLSPIHWCQTSNPKRAACRFSWNDNCIKKLLEHLIMWAGRFRCNDNCIKKLLEHLIMWAGSVSSFILWSLLSCDLNDSQLELVCIDLMSKSILSWPPTDPAYIEGCEHSWSVYDQSDLDSSGYDTHGVTLCHTTRQLLSHSAWKCSLIRSCGTCRTDALSCIHWQSGPENFGIYIYTFIYSMVFLGGRSHLW